MDSFTIRTFEPADIPAVVELQLAYARVFPGAQVLPGEIYLSPGSHAGQDVFCAFHGAQMVAYAPVYFQAVQAGPADLPHRAWVEVKARPGLERAEVIKDQLLARVQQHARALAEPFPGRRVQMVFQYALSEAPAIDYVLARGFTFLESIFTMLRDLRQPVPTFPMPQGITLRRWKMESEPEQRAYIQAHNACFPESPHSLEEWQYFMQSPMWAVGTAIAAFDGDQLAGSVAVYWNDSETPLPSAEGDLPSRGGSVGDTEWIFVRPEYRGRGVARAMIAEGMRYLQEHGRQQARLVVRAKNESALGLYRRLGYQVVSESRFYGKDLIHLEEPFSHREDQSS